MPSPATNGRRVRLRMRLHGVVVATVAEYTSAAERGAADHRPSSRDRFRPAIKDVRPGRVPASSEGQSPPVSVATPFGSHEPVGSSRLDVFRSVLAARSEVSTKTTREESDQMTAIEEKLVEYIDDAYAMEQNVLRMLDGMIDTTKDAQIKRSLERHKKQTEQHAERLEECLREHGASPSKVKEAGGVIGALMKSVVDARRGDKA